MCGQQSMHTGDIFFPICYTPAMSSNNVKKTPKDVQNVSSINGSNYDSKTSSFLGIHDSSTVLQWPLLPSLKWINTVSLHKCTHQTTQCRPPVVCAHCRTG